MYLWHLSSPNNVMLFIVCLPCSVLGTFERALYTHLHLAQCCLPLSLSLSLRCSPRPTCSAALAEQRKQVIQQSKFLGGDMEHTHLVKGLDYALLQKVGRGDCLGSL